MKKIIFLLITFFFLSFTRQTYAHILSTDKSIGAVLHMEPEDDPIVGKPTSFFFEFKDRENKFDSKNCTCIVSVITNEKTVFSQNLFQDAADNLNSNATFSYTFPEKNIYEVVVNGKPNSSNVFNSFKLSYTIRVSRTEDVKSEPENIIQKTLSWLGVHVFHFLIAFVIFVFAIIALIQKYSLSKKKSRED